MSNSMNVKRLSETLDLQDIEKNARAKWAVDTRARRRIEEWLIRSLPYGLVLMVVIFYGLSAGHNSNVLSRMIPDIHIGNLTFNMASVSPLGWELGILIMAGLIAAGWKSPLTVLSLYCLLGLTIVINVAGGTIATIENAARVTDEVLILETMNMNELLARFGTMPAKDQITFLVSIPVGILIPIFGKLAGEGVVKLALGQVRLSAQTDDEKWSQDMRRVMYQALFTAAIDAGAGQKTAGNWAESMVEQLYRVKDAPAPANTSQRVTTAQGHRNGKQGHSWGFAGLLGRNRDNGTSPNPSHHVPTRPIVPSEIEPETAGGLSPMPSHVPVLSQKAVSEWLTFNPCDDLSNREVCRRYMRETYNLDTDAGYKTFERARRDMRTQ